ncbi:MAG: hypothetical protein ACK48U_24055 [Planctomyces sp.]
MTASQDGCRFPVPESRRLTWDLLWLHRSVPLCSHDRRMPLGQLAQLRTAAATRISWAALFIRAFGKVSVEFPQLRQIWFSWPWAHLYQHPESVAVLTVHREFRNAPWLFWGRIRRPEQRSLVDLQACIDEFQNQPVENCFSRELQLAALPTPLRRLIWWWNMHLAGAARARRLGTFFLSTLAGRGAEIQLPPSIQTGCLTYGPLDAQGISRVTLAYDHRIMDGVLAARILERLEQILLQDVAAELQSRRTS